MKLLLCLLAASCVDTVQNGPVPAPTPLAALPSANEVLDAMAQAYAMATSYEDSGTVTVVFSGASSHTNKLAFQTALIRNQRFRFEYRTDREFRGNVVASERMVIWSDFSHTYTEWTTRPGTIEDDGANLGLALAAAAGVSSTTSHLIPGFLLPNVVGAHLKLRTPTLDGVESVDSHPCWRIKATDRAARPLTLWIDRESHLLRRLSTAAHFARFDAEQTIELAPEIGRPIADAMLQPPDITAIPPTPREPLPPQPFIGIEFAEGTTKIDAVVPGGPAERAGLHAGDQIVAVNRDAVVVSSEIVGKVHFAGIGGHLTVTVMRGGSKLDIAVTLGER